MKITVPLDVRTTVAGLLALAVILLPLEGCSAEPSKAPGAAAPAPLSQEQAERRAKLLKILDTETSETFQAFVRNKVIQELVSLGRFDEQYAAVMVRAAGREWRKSFDYGAMPALAAAGRAAVPTIVKALEVAKPAEEESAGLDELVGALGRMGPEAKDAIPALRKLLEKKDLPATDRVALRVALANAGWESKENEDYLLACLRAKSDEGKAAVKAMAWAGLGIWAKKEMVVELGTWLGDPEKTKLDGYDFVHAAIALGTLGERGQDAIAPLRASLKGKDESAIPIVLWSSLARIHPPGKKRTEAVRMMLKATGSFEREKAPGIICVSLLLRDAPMRATLVEMLKDADAAVVNGAIAHIMADGREAPEARAPLQKFVQGPSDALDRYTGARALGMTCSPDDVGMLEKMLAAEKDEYVREGLTESIAMLKLGWKEAGPSDDDQKIRALKEENERLKQQLEKTKKGANP